jgi:hypothetical protein
MTTTIFTEEARTSVLNWSDEYCGKEQGYLDLDFLVLIFIY